MIHLPRLALVTPCTGPDPSAGGLAVLAGLTEAGWRVQHFVARARPFVADAVRWASGLPGRHLDPWLMEPDRIREVFARGARNADLAVVEGTLSRITLAPGPSPYNRPGRLGPIAEALDLPRVALVDCGRPDPLHLPKLPPEVEAIVLDGLESPDALDDLRRAVALVYRRPVVGAIEALPAARAAVGQVAENPEAARAALEVLGRSFARFADLDALAALARSRPDPEIPEVLPFAACGRRFRVAYAQDECFGGYFPDTLETLEALGARLIEFSPLRDERLPEGADLVMIGCGYADAYADALAENECMISALRSHVCSGRRLYSEGGGTAYLGRFLIVDGRPVRGAGILPFDAELRINPRGPVPVRRQFGRDVWLGPVGTEVRGYRSGRWRLNPAPDPGDCPARSGALTGQGDIYYRKNAVGSLIHLHLASLPQVVAAFVGTPRQSSIVPPGGRS